MSVFVTETLACPFCGESQQVDVTDSINGDSRPVHRAGILAGTLQRLICQSCGETTRIDPHLTYLEISRDLWVLVLPHEFLSSWRDFEGQAEATFERAFGSGASPAAREVGARVRPRITFGWPALAEKILAAEHGLDDVTLELLKCGLLRAGDTLAVSDTTEIRLVGTTPESLDFGVFETQGEALIEAIQVPRQLYVDLVDDPAFEALRSELQARIFVDLHALIVGDPAEDEA